MRVLGLVLAGALALTASIGVQAGSLGPGYYPMPNGWNGDWHRTPGVSRDRVPNGSPGRWLCCSVPGVPYWVWSPAAPSSIIPFQTGAARLTAGVIHSQLVLIPSGSGLTPPNEISYRGVKLPRFSAAFGPLVGAAWARFAAGGPASRGGDQASGAGPTDVRSARIPYSGT